MGHGERARALFSEGYNCAQAVAGAFAEELGLPFDAAMKMAASFGGGMGGMRETCGTVSGMLMVIGLARGYSDSAARTEKAEHYARVRAAVGEFVEANGSMLCRELIAASKSGERKKRTCSELVGLAAELAEQYITADEE